MQAYRIHKFGSPHEESWDYRARGHLNAACPGVMNHTPTERIGGDKRPALPGLPGRARRLSPYLRCHRRRRRDALPR
jgi:hypothetical protein